ncbi:MAG: helix-turn-helix transcriptional regulator [Cyclobacteriaceae bacterium]
MDLINKNIRALRKLRNVKSQSEFGEIIGVPAHNINKYEHNVIPKPDVLRSIASQFQVNLHLFITKELTELNFEEFQIEFNTEAKLDSLLNEGTAEYQIKRGDLDRFTTLFGDKLKRLEDNELNEIDRTKLFGDLRAIFLAFNKKLTEFYIMQDHLADIIGDRKSSQP